MKFEGCYHGHGDSLLVKAGSGALTFGQPSSAGVPPAIANETIVLPYNDLAAVEAAFAADGERIAVHHRRAGRRQHEPDRAARRASSRDCARVCDRHGAVLIFDEVMTGFRVHPQGAQGLYGITPDLTTLGKVIGGGMPVGAFGGRRAIMEKIAPLGPVYQAGTLSGNPVAVAAGLATLEAIAGAGLLRRARRARRGRSPTASPAARGAPGVAFAAQAVGGMFGLYFAAAVPDTYDAVMACDKERFNRFFHAMLDAGVYLAPSAFEAGFVSAAHTRRRHRRDARARGDGLRRRALTRPASRERRPPREPARRRGVSSTLERVGACGAVATCQRAVAAGRRAWRRRRIAASPWATDSLQKRAQTLDSSGEKGDRPRSPCYDRRPISGRRNA